jgi:hypothetical protein
MPDLAYVTSEEDQKLLRSIAREIAYDIIPLETILKNHEVTHKQFQEISKQQAFQTMLREYVEVWAGAENTQGRVKMKITSGVEDSLPDMFGLLHDKNFSDNARVELFKTLLQAGGLRGTEKTEGGSSAERVQITINMGAEAPVTVEAVTSGSYIDREGALDVQD